MSSSLANHCKFAAFALIAAATDLHLLPIRNLRSAWHLAHRTTLIPSSPANRIMSRIFAGSLPRMGVTQANRVFVKLHLEN